mmetsp:Transcript_59425/g.140451  ORF Transcript_59425/g.140451 Transcript_59425/m.140451 type:complete len:206 (-) Transcript_59425:710-1327(-)
MLGVARDARRIAVPPVRIDVVDVGELPVRQHAAERVDIEAGLLQHLTARRLGRRLIRAVQRAGHALPVARVVGPLDQQHLQVGRVDDDEDRFGDLEGTGRLHGEKHSGARLPAAGRGRRAGRLLWPAALPRRPARPGGGGGRPPHQLDDASAPSRWLCWHSPSKGGSLDPVIQGPRAACRRSVAVRAAEQPQLTPETVCSFASSA